jgi:hypothetical protein
MKLVIETNLCSWVLIAIGNCYVRLLIIGLNECENVIQEMRNKKARGDDDVPENLLKTLG